MKKHLISGNNLFPLNVNVFKTDYNFTPKIHLPDRIWITVILVLVDDMFPHFEHLYGEAIHKA